VRLQNLTAQRQTTAMSRATGADGRNGLWWGWCSASYAAAAWLRRQGFDRKAVVIGAAGVRLELEEVCAHVRAAAMLALAAPRTPFTSDPKLSGVGSRGCGSVLDAACCMVHGASYASIIIDASYTIMLHDAWCIGHRHGSSKAPLLWMRPRP
jgi:hypothetical protein